MKNANPFSSKRFHPETEEFQKSKSRRLPFGGRGYSHRLDTVLLELSRKDIWTLGDASGGVLILGDIGVGKTRGSGAAFREAFIEHGFGGLVLTAKPDEVALWQQACHKLGRSDSLIVVTPPRGDDPAEHCFNFLQHECNRPGARNGLIPNIVELFLTVAEAGGSHEGSAADPYWDNALRRLLTKAGYLSLLATGTVTFSELCDIVRTAPRSMEEGRDPRWQARSPFYERLLQAKKNALKSGWDDYEEVINYWMSELALLDAKPRTSVESMLTTLATPFEHSPFRQLFCTKTTFVPEQSYTEGKIILLNMPVNEWHGLGRTAQLLFKTVWQRAVLARDRSQRPFRPVFLWADEAHQFLTRFDALYQTQVRDSLGCTVFISQNLANFQSVLAGRGGKEAADTLIACLSTKIFHANGHQETNRWAEQLFGTESVYQPSSGWTTNINAGGSSSISYAPAELPVVRSREFTMLKTGGNRNAGVTEAVVFKTGRTWKHTGSNYLIAKFSTNSLEARP